MHHTRSWLTGCGGSCLLFLMVCRSVACGHEHTVCITTKDVFAWGSNEYGQLGHGDAAPDICSRPFPIKVLHDVMVTQVGGGGQQAGRQAGSCTRGASAAARQQQSCHGSSSSTSPAAVGLPWAVAASTYGGVRLLASDAPVWVKTSPASLQQGDQLMLCQHCRQALDAQLLGCLVVCGYCLQVVCGRLHTICVTAQSQVYAWGHNSAGQLGLSDRRDRWASV
jgi:hypothetical protein